MLQPRITPCLLIHNGGLVKTTNFKNPKYIGDPINAVKIFNEKEADELIVLDIDSSANGSLPNFDMIGKLAAECRMPLCYGGGIKTKEHAKQIISLGVEKISISSAAIEDVNIVTSIANEIGSQSIVVAIDVAIKNRLFGSDYEIVTHNSSIKHKGDLFEFIKKVEDSGAGEILINSVDYDGLMTGYNLPLAFQIKQEINIPMTFLGGAGSLDDLQSLAKKCGVIGIAAGSLFVFKGKYKAVLINYPNNEQKSKIFDSISK
jgi:imidazole glycerol-phosphate synthase subunit HisF